MIVFVVLGVILLYIVSVYNQIVRLEVKVEESKSGIDVALSKRYTVLTNMQESVKGYMKHENEVLSKVVQLRKNMSISELSEANEKMNALQQQILMLAESYPQLKASDLFRDFNEALVDCEEHLQAARRFYNSNVSLFNEKLVMFPSSVIAGKMNKEEMEYFEAEQNEKSTVSVRF